MNKPKCTLSGIYGRRGWRETDDRQKHITWQGVLRAAGNGNARQAAEYGNRDGVTAQSGEAVPARCHSSGDGGEVYHQPG